LKLDKLDQNVRGGSMFGEKRGLELEIVVSEHMRYQNINTDTVIDTNIDKDSDTNDDIKEQL
jgi:hypothetical protein